MGWNEVTAAWLQAIGALLAILATWLLGRNERRHQERQLKALRYAEARGAALYAAIELPKITEHVRVALKALPRDSDVVSKDNLAAWLVQVRSDVPFATPMPVSGLPNFSALDAESALTLTRLYTTVTMFNFRMEAHLLEIERDSGTARFNFDALRSRLEDVGRLVSMSTMTMVRYLKDE